MDCHAESGSEECGERYTRAAGIGPNAVHAADLAGPVAREIVRQDATSAYCYGGFNPILDPSCRIIPQPEATLFGDTACFRPTAVCESRGLYPGSVCFGNLFVLPSDKLAGMAFGKALERLANTAERGHRRRQRIYE
jgi:hypothetical protein